MFRYLLYSISLLSLPLLLMASCTAQDCKTNGTCAPDSGNPDVTVPKDCNRLATFIQDFANKHQTCQSDKDCRLIGFGGSKCDGGGAYVAIHVDAADQAQGYFDTFRQAQCVGGLLPGLPADAVNVTASCSSTNRRCFIDGGRESCLGSRDAGRE